eukprot:Opistho-2@42608
MRRFLRSAGLTFVDPASDSDESPETVRRNNARDDLAAARAELLGRDPRSTGTPRTVLSTAAGGSTSVNGGSNSHFGTSPQSQTPSPHAQSTRSSSRSQGSPGSGGGQRAQPSPPRSMPAASPTNTTSGASSSGQTSRRIRSPFGSPSSLQVDNVQCLCCGGSVPLPRMPPGRAACPVCQSTLSLDAYACFMSPAARVVTNVRHEHLSLDLLRNLAHASHISGDYAMLQNVLSDTFRSPELLNRSFLKAELADIDDCTLVDPGVDMDAVRKAFELVVLLPRHVHVGMLSSVHALVMEPRKPQHPCDLRFLMILLELPFFSETDAFDTFVRVLGLIGGLPNADHHHIVHWLKGYAECDFERLVNRIQKLLAVRVMTAVASLSAGRFLSDWRVIAATKTLALFYAANRMSTHPLVDVSIFYCKALQHIDFVRDYDAWQTGYRGFFFCQYSFLMPINAKMAILELDAQRQMNRELETAIVSSILRGVSVDPYLTLVIRRDHLIEDSLNQIAMRQQELKKKIRVKFQGEPGIDAGGLQKEWFFASCQRNLPS